MARTFSYTAALTLSTVAWLAVAACSSAVSGEIGTSGAGGGGPACGSCYYVYANGGIPCGPGDSADAWRTLSLCACGSGKCASACTMSFCASLPADMTCGECLVATCSAEEMGCAGN
jgi:hypothetical protein